MILLSYSLAFTQNNYPPKINADETVTYKQTPQTDLKLWIFYPDNYKKNDGAEELGVSEKEVLQMEARMGSQDTAFDLSSDDGDDNSNFSPAQYLEDKSENVEAAVINADYDSNASARLYSAIKTLDERSQYIIETRWLNDNKMTLQDLAAKYEVSAERVRQIEKNAMKKIQAAMS